MNDLAALRRDAADLIISHFANNASIQKGAKIFARGEGCYLYDLEGRKYLDTFASLLTTICGHHRREVADAIRRQLDALEFFPNYEDAFTVPLVELARKLAQIMPGDLRVSFFVNSGSEANETALKMARQYHVLRGEPQRFKIIARQLSYHGTTLGGISVTGLPWFREYFEPLLPGCIFTPPVRRSDGDAALETLRKIVAFEGPKQISAIIMDPIPGSNTGYPLPPEGYLEGVRALCDEHGIVLIFDEVQTGFGKTGKWFACEHYHVVPDIMTIGKGFSGGYVPLGAAVTTPKIADIFRKPGNELRSGSTYGGHTIACAATLANIGIIENEKLVDRAAKVGDYLERKLRALQKHPMVGDITGLGLLRAVHLKPEPAGAGAFVRDYCYERGMIMRNNGNLLVLAPALVIAEAEIDFAADLLDQAIGAAMKHFG